jgi:hypothetical protein
MDSNNDRPLTPEEAKARLRKAAQQVSLDRWVGQHPWQVLVGALIGGFIVGRVGVSAVARTIVARRVAPMLLTMVIPKKRKEK